MHVVVCILVMFIHSFGMLRPLVPQCSLQRPEYQHYREKFGTARSIDAFEKISIELKTLLLVNYPTSI